MSQSTPVKIVLVDDDQGRHSSLRELLGPTVSLVIRDPQDVFAEDIQGADLVSVDEYLGDEWSLYASSENTPASSRNMDGLAVAASLQSQVRENVDAFAISVHTADLNRLGVGLPLHSREGLVAAQHDLDWVFEVNAPNNAARMISLAMAVRSMRAHVESVSRDFGVTWLRLPGEQEWSSLAIEQVEDCRPPAHALAANTLGRSYLRWLAQRVIPYPTFLQSDAHVANMLGIQVESFEELAANSRVEDLDIEYRGPLEGFAGRRWWRAGWQQLLSAAGESHWSSPAEKALALSRSHEIELVPLNASQPVVAYDSSGRISSIDAEASASIRLQADGWPVFADDPWAKNEEALADPDLLRLANRNDRLSLGGFA